jgi:hypothetical protein
MDRHVTPEPLPEESPALNPAEPPAAVDIYIVPTSKQQALEATKALNGADAYVAPRPKKRLPPPPKAWPRPGGEASGSGYPKAKALAVPREALLSVPPKVGVVVKAPSLVEEACAKFKAVVGRDRPATLRVQD